MTAVEKEKETILRFARENGRVQFAGIIGCRAALELEREGLVELDFDGPRPSESFPGGSGSARAVGVSG